MLCLSSQRHRETKRKWWGCKMLFKRQSCVRCQEGGSIQKSLVLCVQLQRAKTTYGKSNLFFFKDGWSMVKGHPTFIVFSYLLTRTVNELLEYKPLKVIFHSHWCWKITEKVSFSIASGASSTFTFFSGQKFIKNAKNGSFSDILKTWSLRLNSVTRQVNFNWAKIGEKCQN